MKTHATGAMTPPQQLLVAVMEVKHDMNVNKSIMASLLVIGLVSVGAGAGTMAWFNDMEQSSDNTFAAGSVDLKIDWEEHYNGEVIETQELTDNPSTIFELSDLKPGDHGEATISYHIYDNPAWLWFKMDRTNEADNTCREPEKVAEGGECDPDGNLGEELRFTIWYDDGDNVFEEGEKHIAINRTADELQTATDTDGYGLETGYLLDGDTSTPNEKDAFGNSTTHYMGVKWYLPTDAGNEIQSDSLTYDFSFYAEQERNNPDPENPFAN